MQSFYIDDVIAFLILGIVCVVIPGMFTIWNIYNCVSSKPKKEKLISGLTIIIGGIFYLLLHVLSFEEAGDWYEQINTMQYHNIISSESYVIDWIVLFGFVGYFILLFIDADKLPPLVSVISISLLILLNLFQIAYAIQISKNVNGLELLLYVYHINILILSARVIHRQMAQQVELFRSRAPEMEQHKGFKKFFEKVNSLSKYTIVVFITLFFVIAIIEIIFVIAGQGVDAPMKAFTDTADWSFSKQIPPPPIEYDGHYLCTVAAGGHKKIVKPLRFGTRRGQTIVVNRQLCIANAFEEVIRERFPSFHRRIRYVYDTYGYPVSGIITSPLRADFVYFLMKPFEWCFLLFLYMFDLRPEQRIKRQYIWRDEK